MRIIRPCGFCGGDSAECGHLAPLADADLYPPSNGVDTSNAAAASVADDTGTLRAMFYRMVRGLELHGATSDELEQRSGLPHQTVSPRLWELHHKLGLIVDSGRRRPTVRGRAAIVYVATCWLQRATG